MTDPAATIRRLHQKHCRRAISCYDDVCRWVACADPDCEILRAIKVAHKAGYRAAVGDCAELAESIPGLGVVGYAVAQTIKALAPEGPPAG